MKVAPLYGISQIAECLPDIQSHFAIILQSHALLLRSTFEPKIKKALIFKPFPQGVKPSPGTLPFTPLEELCNIP